MGVKQKAARGRYLHSSGIPTGYTGRNGSTSGPGGERCTPPCVAKTWTAGWCVGYNPSSSTFAFSFFFFFFFLIYLIFFYLLFIYLKIFFFTLAAAENVADVAWILKSLNLFCRLGVQEATYSFGQDYWRFGVLADCGKRTVDA